MVWQQICVITEEQYAPEMADFFSHQGALSVTYMDAEDEPVYEPAIGEVKIWTNTQVIALFEQDDDLRAIRTKFDNRFQPDRYEDWNIDIIQDQAWERAWLEHYRPMKFGGRLWVCPTDQIQQEENTVCLILDPGLAFGTGTHPTTALCLEWLAGFDLKDKTIIDYGCGSGILAIAALLLGAKRVYAVDIDPQAITATLMNAEKNRVIDNIICLLPEQFSKEQIQGDVLIANILAKPLIDMAPYLSGLAVSAGHIALSGILAEQADAVAAAYYPKITLNGRMQKDDWIRLTGMVH